MKFLNYIVLTLVIVGALNWLLIGFFNFNLVNGLFGGIPALSRIIYSLVGICGLWAISFYSKVKE